MINVLVVAAPECRFPILFGEQVERSGIFITRGLFLRHMAELARPKILTVDRPQGTSDLWLDGAFELVAVSEVQAATTGHLVQTAQMLPALVEISQELNESA